MRRALAAGLVALVVIVHAGCAVSARQAVVRITYLYDNTAAVQGAKPDWGFACLLEGHGQTLLFDTGAKPEILRANMATLKVHPSRIQAVVLSHEHSDHTAGLGALPASPGLPVYIGEHFNLPAPATAALTRIGARRMTVTSGKPVEAFPGFLVSEEISRNGAFEEALVVDTPAGSVVVIGCAHPGIVEMLRRIAQTTKRPIYMVIGGFHLLQTPAEDVKRIIADFKAMGIAWAGPTHCTGDEAIRLFREAYRDHFVTGGVGTVVEVPQTSATR